MNLKHFKLYINRVLQCLEVVKDKGENRQKISQIWLVMLRKHFSSHSKFCGIKKYFWVHKNFEVQNSIVVQKILVKKALFKKDFWEASIIFDGMPLLEVGPSWSRTSIELLPPQKEHNWPQNVKYHFQSISVFIEYLWLEIV